MGNFAVISPQLISTERVVCFEGSDPGDLEGQLQAFINGLVTAAAEGFADVAFVGSGDGLHFMVTFVLSTGATPIAAGTIVRVYGGTGETEFQRNANAALARTTGSFQITRHAVAGSATGARWMGLFLAQAP